MTGAQQHNRARSTATMALGVSLLLAACDPAGPEPQANAQSQPADAYANASVVAPEIVTAMCEGRARDVVTFLSSEPLSSPVDQMYLAVALEASGRELDALDIYDRLGALSNILPVVIRCGTTVVMAGEVSELARFRADRRRALIARKDALNAAAAAVKDYADATAALTAADLKTAQMIAREGGDPKVVPAKGVSDDTPMKDVASTKDKPKRQTGPIEVAKPDSTSQSGLYLAHLASYKSEDNVEPGIKALEARYPALTGALSSWSLTENNQSIWRVGVRTINFADAEALCEEVKKAGDYCRVLDTTS